MKPVTATLAELEARVAALEADRADYRAVLAAVNALGVNEREHTLRVGSLEKKVDARSEGLEAKVETLSGKVDTLGGYVRTLEEGQADIKDLLIQALAKR